MTSARLGEFDFIRDVLAPLAGDGPPAFGLTDDAAAFLSPPGQDLVISTDMIVQGRHFLDDDPADAVARKLIRVNLSDLAAKGAEPVGLCLSIAWPDAAPAETLTEFARGLADDLGACGLTLWGGDTTATGGAWTLSATVFGLCPQGRMLRRRGARVGEGVFVTGTIGDGGLGLRAARGEALGLSAPDQAALADRYRCPRPRLGFIAAHRETVSAGLDVSDGLIADLGHLSEQSGVRLRLDLERLPLSEAAEGWLTTQPDPLAARRALATAGDDYEIAFTAPLEAEANLRTHAAGLDLRVTRIGTVEAGAGVDVRFAGAKLAVDAPGFKHF
ncbi:MAG: thiamine-phosphate kinase [Maricaulaceae bacterium]